MISAIIPVLNEPEDTLIETLHHLTHGCPVDDLEVILVNDGSVNDDGSRRLLESYDFPSRIKQYLKFIDNGRRHGVGYSMDRGSEVATGDILVLMGGDIIVGRSWLYDVKNMAKQGEIGCCCSVGLSPGNYDIEKADLYHRYGAKLLYTIGVDDLPKNSPLRKDPNYRDILGGQFQPKKADEPYEISCLMGAFYWMKREDYVRIHGFDTEKGREYIGHRYYGALEPYLSLKAEVYGMKLRVYPDFKVGHTFSRIEDIYTARSLREDYVFWNKLLIAYTMLEDSLKDKCLNFLRPCLNLSQAQNYIKKNWDVVQRLRNRNIAEGKLVSE
jgi:glycosyltransferase involved in cell wall biosynthesis